jgi:fluoride exporter
MKVIMLVFAGGGIGSVCRYAINRLSARFLAVFPFGTLFSNVLSCLLMGLIVGFSFRRADFDPALKLLLLTGFCGGFSTFSSFTLETYELARTGYPGIAFLNVTGNLLVCLAALISGIFVAKFL